MRLIDTVLNALFPERTACCSCGREAATGDNGLCEECSTGIEIFNSAPTLPGIEDYTAAYVYNDVSSRIVKNLKYKNAKYLAKPLAEAIRIPPEWQIDVVVPVPLHYKRIRRRGYNQSELIAKHLSKRLGLNTDITLLIRTVDTRQQVRMTEAGRKRNVKDAFAADEACKGLNILLIDDVRTTGATLTECAKALKNAGCGKVYAATACFAQDYEKDDF